MSNTGIAQQALISTISQDSQTTLGFATMPQAAKIATIGVGVAAGLTAIATIWSRIRAKQRDTLVITKLSAALGAVVKQSEFAREITLRRNSGGAEQALLDQATALMGNLARGFQPTASESSFIYQKSLPTLTRTIKKFPPSPTQIDASIGTVIGNIKRLADNPRKLILR